MNVIDIGEKEIEGIRSLAEKKEYQDPELAKILERYFRAVPGLLEALRNSNWHALYEILLSHEEELEAFLKEKRELAIQNAKLDRDLRRTQALLALCITLGIETGVRCVHP